MDGALKLLTTQLVSDEFILILVILDSQRDESLLTRKRKGNIIRGGPNAVRVLFRGANGVDGGVTSLLGSREGIVLVVLTVGLIIAGLGNKARVDALADSHKQAIACRMLGVAFPNCFRVTAISKWKKRVFPALRFTRRIRYGRLTVVEVLLVE